MPVSERSDIYSIGVMLYEMLTGRLPFDGESAVSIALKHVSEQPERPSTYNPAISVGLEAVRDARAGQGPGGALPRRRRVHGRAGGRPHRRPQRGRRAAARHDAVHRPRAGRAGRRRARRGRGGLRRAAERCRPATGPPIGKTATSARAAGGCGSSGGSSRWRSSSSPWCCCSSAARRYAVPTGGRRAPGRPPRARRCAPRASRATRRRCRRRQPRRDGHRPGPAGRRQDRARARRSTSPSPADRSGPTIPPVTGDGRNAATNALNAGRFQERQAGLQVLDRRRRPTM